MKLSVAELREIIDSKVSDAVMEERIRIAGSIMLRLCTENYNDWTRNSLLTATVAVAPSLPLSAAHGAYNRFRDAGLMKIIPPDQVIFDHEAAVVAELDWM